MKRFNYKAKGKATGKTLKGSIQAENEQIAGHLLVEQGYIPDTIVEEGANSALDKYKNRITTKDRIMFTRQLATLIGAGLPLASSLRTVSEQTESKGMKSVAEEILASVESGKSLHDSFSLHPEIFNGVYLALIQAGETSGTLDSRSDYRRACFHDDCRCSASPWPLCRYETRTPRHDQTSRGNHGFLRPILVACARYCSRRYRWFSLFCQKHQKRSPDDG